MDTEKETDTGADCGAIGMGNSAVAEQSAADGKFEIVADRALAPDAETGDIPEELAVRERVIAEGEAAFRQVGRALLEIRSKELYRHRMYQTFDEYCRGHWGFGSSYASRLCGETLLAQRLPGAPKQSHLRALLPAVKKWKAKEGPDFSAAVEIYAEAAGERGDSLRALDLEAKVREFKKAKGRARAVEEPSSKSNEGEVQDAPSAPIGRRADAGEQQTSDTPDIPQVLAQKDAPELGETSEAVSPKYRMLAEARACERELVCLLKRLRHRLKVNHDDLTTLRAAYQKLQRVMLMVDPDHEPLLPPDELPELPVAMTSRSPRGRLVNSLKAGQDTTEKPTRRKRTKRTA